MGREGRNFLENEFCNVQIIDQNVRMGKRALTFPFLRR